MGSNDMNLNRRHIVMAPFMSQGHLIPFLALANQITKRYRFTITIATTPLNLQYLHKATKQHSSNINLVALPFSSSDHGLPPNTENADALSLDQFALLLIASMSLKDTFRILIDKITYDDDGVPPLCIISDVFFGWANEVAKVSDTVNITFTTGGAYGTAAFVSLRQNLPHIELKSGEEEFIMPGFSEKTKFNVSILPKYIRATNGTDVWCKFFQSQLRLSCESEGWLCNTAADIEKRGLEILKNYLKLPVWPIGPLLPETMLKQRPVTNGSSATQHLRTGKEYGISPSECLKWLDRKSVNSVLFISFGSQNSIKPLQMKALAVGLEMSGVSFIWVIRPPIGSDIKTPFRPEWLPDEFQSRTTNNGLLIHQWAPQLEILAHKSTGAFLSHCGWNSILEALCQGVPIISWPLAAEQPYNSKMLVEEMGVAVEICKGMDEILTAETVKEVVEKVIKNETGLNLRRNAEKIGVMMKESMKDDEGCSVMALDECIAYVMSITSV